MCRSVPRALAGLLGLAVALTACTGAAAPETAGAHDTTAAPATPATPAATASPAPTAPTAVPSGSEQAVPPPPDVPEGPVDPATAVLLDRIFTAPDERLDTEAIRGLGASGDARTAWLLADLLRFVQSGPNHDAAVASFEDLTSTTVDGGDPWNVITDRLIAWDLPAPPGYAAWKASLFTIVEPGWAPFFADADSEIDWRLVTWGGVPIDDRPLDAVDEPCPQGCIPALNDPAVTDAAGGSWYPDHFVVFGVVVDGEARAYPKNVMEVHEMVNDRLGGRRIAVPYCTLCGSAQAYYTDDVAPGTDVGGTDAYELRTSGLLVRSNKVTYEFHTRSVIDTFTGEALSGPLLDAGVELAQLSVVTATWGDWKAAHPDTTIVAADGGIGREYPDDPLGGRDDAGPIFPIGDVDPRLPVQEQVLGVIAPSGEPVAFPARAARDVLDAGGEVAFDGVQVRATAGGLTASGPDGAQLTSHQAFWFAWSQFHPDTRVWTPADVR